MNPDTGRDNYNALYRCFRPSTSLCCSWLRRAYEAAVCGSRSPNDDATRDVSCLLRGASNRAFSQRELFHVARSITCRKTAWRAPAKVPTPDHISLTSFNAVGGGG